MLSVSLQSLQSAIFGSQPIDNDKALGLAGTQGQFILATAKDSNQNGGQNPEPWRAGSNGESQSRILTTR